jgi:hypothetical protein
MSYVIQTKKKSTNSRHKWHHRSNGHNWCLQNISSGNSTIYILLSSPWNFLQSRPYLWHKASLDKYKKIEIPPCILSDHNAIKVEFKTKETEENI